MSYCFARSVALPFEQAVARVTEELKAEGFGILTQIDVQATLKEKLGVDFRKYRILGACNPALAHQALQIEDKIGMLLPCNVIVQEQDARRTEVAAINPMETMKVVHNPKLEGIALQVEAKLKRIIDRL